jgi:hypothetical protein
VEYNGEIYRWSKHHEWEKFLGLPRRTGQPLELAMMPDDPADLDRLQAYGWQSASVRQIRSSRIEAIDSPLPPL